MLRRFAQVAGLTLMLGMVAVPAAHADTRFSLQIGPVVVAHPGYVWQPAYRVWTGYGYRWVPGAWVPVPYWRGGYRERVYRNWDHRGWDRGRDYDRRDWRNDHDYRR